MITFQLWLYRTLEVSIVCHSFDERICIIRIIFHQIEIKSIKIIGVKILRFTFQEDMFHEKKGIRSKQGLNGHEMTSIECSR